MTRPPEFHKIFIAPSLVAVPAPHDGDANEIVETVYAKWVEYIRSEVKADILRQIQQYKRQGGPEDDDTK